MPVLYIKVVGNSAFILAYNRREKFKGEDLVMLISIILGPVLIIMSLLVDLVKIPNKLNQDQKSFELKYQNSENMLNPQQIEKVN